MFRIFSLLFFINKIKVFEVNSSSLRNKYQIIQELEGALNSHHVSNNKSAVSSATTNKKEAANQVSNFKIQNFFKTKPTNLSSLPPPAPYSMLSPLKTKKHEQGYVSPQTKSRKKRKISLRKETVLSAHNHSSNTTDKKTITAQPDSTYDSSDSSISIIELDKSDSSPCSSENSVKIHTESLILFEEIDVIFKDDVGFLSAVNHFIKKSKKPILLTTNDDYLQEKINLNIEKIDFVRPRIEAAIKFLKKVASAENKELDKPTANKIIQECNFDMRRALMQFHVLCFSTRAQKLIALSDNNTHQESFDLNQHLSRVTFLKCKFHNEETFFQNIFLLDSLSRSMCKFNANIYFDLSIGFKKYDLFILRDGLTDNSSLSTTATVSFNPFNLNAPQTGMQANSEDNVDFNIDDFNKSNSILVRDFLYDLYETYMCLFNEFKCVKFQDWYKHGAVNQFNYSSNVSMNRFAAYAFKLTSNSSLTLDYRPFLHQICQIEDLKQASCTSRRRYINYLSRLNIGLIKEDYSLLAKSNLNENSEQARSLTETNKISKADLDPQIYSNDS